MEIRKYIALLVFCLFTASAYADIELRVTYTDKNGSEITATESFSAEAPLHLRLTSNPSGLDAGATIEWHIKNNTAGINITRYEENTEYDLTVAGVTEITLQVVLDNEVIESSSLRITISSSHLEMPNAFSPNGDGFNDIYRAKQDNYKSIVEFHAYIFNRNGQKLYEWNNITGGWDGTHNGHPVKDGVYFVYVKARGADGIEYNIRRDVNLIRNFNTVDTNNQ